MPKRTEKRRAPNDRKDKYDYFGGMRYLRRGGDRRTRKRDRKQDSRRRRR